MRSFSSGPNTLFEYRPGMPFAGMGGVCVRSSIATYVDNHNVLRTAAANELRDNHWVNGVRQLLHEASSTNLCIQASDLANAAWTKRGTCTAVKNVIGPDGKSNSASTVSGLNTGVNDVFQTFAATITTGTRYEPSFWCKKVSTSGTINVFNPQSSAAGQWTVDLSLLGTGWEYITRDHPAVTIQVEFVGNGNLGGFHLRGATGGALSIAIFCCQGEIGSWSSSSIETTTATVTRAAETISFPFNATPQLMTVLVRAIYLGAAAGTRLLQLSSNADINEARMVIYMPAAQGTMYHQNGALTAVTATPSGTLNYGDEIAFRGVLRADGSVLAGKTINGGAEALAGPSAANALAGSWDGGTPHLYLGSAGGGVLQANWAISDVRIVKGEQTLAYMQNDFLTAISSDKAEMVHLLQFEFDTGIVSLSTGAQDLSWNSTTWEAVGGLLEFGGVQETSDGKGQGVDVKLSGVDQSLLAILLGAKYRGRYAMIWRAYLDQTTGQFVGDPVKIFQGLQLNPYTVEEQRERHSGNVTISTRLTGYLGVERVRGIQSNLISHQHEFAGDTFFKNAAALANSKVYWGTKAAATPGQNTGNSNPRNLP